MKSIATLALASALLSTAAYAQSMGEKTGVNSTLARDSRSARQTCCGSNFINQAASTTQ
jgi:hypothetical protein